MPSQQPTDTTRVHSIHRVNRLRVSNVQYVRFALQRRSFLSNVQGHLVGTAQMVKGAQNSTRAIIWKEHNASNRNQHRTNTSNQHLNRWQKVRNTAHHIILNVASTVG